VLELTVMQLAYNFGVSPGFMVLLLVLWIFGICMIAMAALIHLPFRWLTALSVAVIAFHNCLDGIEASQFGSADLFWNFLRQPGVISIAGRPVLLSYTFLPWIAVMSAGFCFGRVFRLEPLVRQRIMLRTGLALTIAFVVIRAVQHVRRSGALCPSEVARIHISLFPQLHQIPWIARLPADDIRAFIARPGVLRSAKVHGRQSPDRLRRAPLFYFVLHFYLIHALAAGVRYGTASARFIFNPLPSMGGPADLFPADFGYRLCVVYAMWILTMALLYPLCRRFAKVKATRSDWWLSYL
jgi:uncharacterized membrane protein